MLKQNLQQKLLQKLSPQQIQFIKLLQVPTTALDSRIKEELEENPALEDNSLMTADDAPGEYEEYEKDGDDTDVAADEDILSDISVDDYLQDDGESDYSASYLTADEEEEKKETPIVLEQTFFEGLQQQLDLVPLSDRDFIIATQIVGSLDDDGYLRRPIESMIDDLAFSQNIEVEASEILEMLKLIQSFDPAGVGARNLQECLLIQLRRKEQSNSIIQKAIYIVEKYLDEFTRKHYDKLERALNLNSAQLKEVVNEILKLNPKPGDTTQVSSKQMQIIPDFHIANNNGVLVLTLNGKNAPELKVSKNYLEMFDHYEKSAQKDKKLKEAVQFVKQKLDSAKWFIDAVKQRQQTLLKTMNAILQYQYEYFLTGDDRKLKPMILKDIAEKIDMDISTVSRVANSKYVQTEHGTYLLKSFFSEGIQREDGEEVSNKEVKKILEDCIGNEDKRKPLADEKLTDILKERGYNIARRTVAKYREQLNIPVARLRKEL